MQKTDPYKIAQQVLEPGEKLLWAGRPEGKTYMWGGHYRGRHIFSVIQVVIGIILYRGARSNLAAGLDLTGKPTDVPPSDLSLAGVTLIAGLFVVGGLLRLLPLAVRRLRSGRVSYFATNWRLAEVRSRGGNATPVVMEAEICRLGARKYRGLLGHLIWNTHGITGGSSSKVVSKKGVNEGFWGILGAAELSRQLLPLPIVRHALGQFPPRVGNPDAPAEEPPAGQQHGVRAKSADPDPDLSGLLNPGEQVQWSGRAGVFSAGIARTNGLALIGGMVGALVAAGVGMLVWEGGTEELVRRSTNKGLWIAAAIALIAGVMLIWQVASWASMSGVRYLVTNQRVLEVKGRGSASRVRTDYTSQPLAKLWVPKSGRRGHLLFGRGGVMAEIYGRGAPLGLLAIQDPARVRAIIAQQPYAAHLFSDGEGQA